MAGIEPKDLDVFEVHDAFTIMAALSLEASGFAERGKGVQLGLDNEISPKGCIPICTRGGLKARGHPVGATGMYQIVEVVNNCAANAAKLKWTVQKSAWHRTSAVRERRSSHTF